MASAAKSMLLSAGAGVMVAAAGLYLAKKVKRYFSTKRRMRLFQNNLLLSTRCAWFLSELGAEEDFEMSTGDDSPFYSSDYLFSKLDTMPSYSIEPSGNNRRLIRQEEDYQVVAYNPNISREDLSICSPEWDDSLSDYGSQDSVTPSISACLINDEFTLIEGAAICMYLADLYGQFLPDAEHKAEYYSWIVYSAATFDNIVKTLHLQMVETPECQRNSQILDSALSGFNAFARALSESLNNKNYLCGNNFTAADCVLGFTLWWAYTIERGKLLDGYPVLLAYLNRLQTRRAFERTFGQQDRWDWSRYLMTCIKDNLNI